MSSSSSGRGRQRRQRRHRQHVVPRQGVRRRERVGRGQHERRPQRPTRSAVGGRGAGDAGEQHRQRDDDDDGGGGDHGAHGRPRQRPGQQLDHRPPGRGQRHRPARALQLLEDVRPGPQVQRHRDDARRRRPGPRPGASAARRSSSRQRPEDGHARDAVRHLGAQGRAQQQPRRPRAVGRRGRSRPGPARSPAGPGARRGPRRRRRPGWRSRARPRGAAAAGSVARPAAAASRTSSQAATTDHLADPHRLPAGCRRRARLVTAWTASRPGRRCSASWSRAARPRWSPGRCRRASHRRHDVRVAALRRDPAVRRVVDVVGGPERRVSSASAASASGQPQPAGTRGRSAARRAVRPDRRGRPDRRAGTPSSRAAVTVAEDRCSGRSPGAHPRGPRPGRGRGRRRDPDEQQQGEGGGQRDRADTHHPVTGGAAPGQRSPRPDAVRPATAGASAAARRSRRAARASHTSRYCAAAVQLGAPAPTG